MLDKVKRSRNDTSVYVHVEPRFFEGASEGTTDRADTQSYDTLLWAGSTSNFETHLDNDEDDWATIRASIGNWKIFLS